MKRIYLYTLPIRIWHWVNGAIIMLLLLTGFQLRVSEAAIFSEYGFVVSFHKYLGFALTASFVFWLIYYLVTGGLWRHYIMKPKDLKGTAIQAAYYGFNIFRGRANPFVPSPEEKFNPLQKISYFSVMAIFTPVVIITGILFSDVVYFADAIRFLGGLRILDAIHVAAGYIFIIYLIVHIYMCTLGPTIFAHIKAMITGFEEEQEPPAP